MRNQNLTLADKIALLEEAMNEAQQALNKAKFYLYDFPDETMAEFSFSKAIEILTNGTNEQGGKNED